jgi:hypothetical protein
MAYKVKNSKNNEYSSGELFGAGKKSDIKQIFKEENEYDKQANKFLKDTNTTFKVKYIKHDKYFPDDKEERDIYRFTLTKDGKSYSGRFGQSIADTGKKPRPYDVLTSLGADRFEGTFQDFCDEYGYDCDSMKAHNTYKAVVKENEGLKKLYSEEERDKMSEIQ